MTTEELSTHVVRNREVWDEHLSVGFGATAPELWAAQPQWSLWRTPQVDLPVFPEDLRDKDLIELGCGTAYVSAWAARLGARPVGVDNSARQLATAAAMQRRYGVGFPLVHGNAEDVPFRDASFDIAISEHGASTWCDPYRWIPEAARLLRPGGELIFVRNSTVLELCRRSDGPARPQLQRDQFKLWRLPEEDGGVRFHLPAGPMIQLLRSAGFEIEDLIEVYAPEGASSFFDFVDPEWARHWPSNEVWKARRRPR